MLILLFVFVGTTYYVIKNGVGKEKLLFLYPLGAYLLISIGFGAVVAIAPSMKGVGETIMGLPATIVLVSICVWIVKKVRSNSMSRVLAAMKDGTFKEPEKRLDL